MAMAQYLLWVVNAKYSLGLVTPAAGYHRGVRVHILHARLKHVAQGVNRVFCWLILARPGIQLHSLDQVLAPVGNHKTRGVVGPHRPFSIVG